MARKPQQQEPPKLPLLLAVPREDARARLRERVEKAQLLLGLAIRSFEELDDAERAVSTWSAFNVELLRRLFTSPELAEEYSFCGVGGFVTGRDLHREARSFIDGVKDKIHRIESIIERLELIPEAAGVAPAQPLAATAGRLLNSTRVFVVHGHDQEARETVARFIERLGLEPIILHEQPTGGRTVIEKLEHHGDVAFAVVLLTPDDVGKASSSSDDPVPRARQNVVLELGYFVGRLGRSHVCALHKGALELPSDYLGVVYVPLDAHGGWRLVLARELKSAGFSIDLNEVL